MNVRSVLGRLKTGDLQYVLGRFKTVRVSYSHIQQLRGRRCRVPPEVACRTTLFPHVDVDGVVRSVRESAVFVGMNLPPAIVGEIADFGRTTALFARHDPSGADFYHADVVRGRTRNGRQLPLGSIRNPMICPAVRAVVEDPVLREVARQYLGYEPSGVLPILFWSFASDFSDDERRRLKQHVIDYHYDVGGFNFVYANFYIVDTDRNSGAHVLMKNSHNRKPLRLLLGSAAASEAEVHRLYGRENELVIEGPGGTGFIQDTACYHRATPPTYGDRLLLQVRFS